MPPKKKGPKRGTCPHCRKVYNKPYLNLHKASCKGGQAVGIGPVRINRIPRPSWNSAAICFILAYLLGPCGLWTAKLMAYLTLGAIKLGNGATDAYSTNKNDFVKFISDLDSDPKQVQEKGATYWKYLKKVGNYAYDNFWCAIETPS